MEIFYLLSCTLTFVEKEIDLTRPCETGDVCDDENAECIGGRCTCRPKYYQDGATCSECVSLMHASVCVAARALYRNAGPRYNILLLTCN